MFAPDGYVPLSALERRVPVPLIEAADEKHKETYREVEATSRSNGPRFFAKWSPQDSLERSILRSVQDHAFAASAQGSIVKLDLSSLLNAVDFWEFSTADLDRLEKEYGGIGERPPHFRYVFKLPDITMEELASEYEEYAKHNGDKYFIDFTDEAHFRYCNNHIPFFYERIGYTISLQSYDFFRRFDFVEMPEFVEVARIMRQFEGWSLCVPESYISSGWTERLRSELRLQEVRPSNSIGRPGFLRDETLAAYLAIYPSGNHPGMWGEALREVNRKTGLNVSVDTLKRAVSDWRRSKSGTISMQNPPQNSGKSAA